MTHSTGRRGGFTLTELMVSLALIVFIMSILSAAVGAASKSVRDLKAANELAERLRGIVTLLRQDLRELSRQTHLGPGTNQRRLSQGQWTPEANPDGQGFLRIWQVGRPTAVSGLAVGGETPTVSVGSAIHFTTFLSGAFPADTYATELPDLLPQHSLLSFGTNEDKEGRYQSTNPGSAGPPRVSGNRILRSRVAEISWFLVNSNDVTFQDPNATAPANASQPLMVLCRRTRLVREQNVTGPASAASDAPWNDQFDNNYREVAFPPQQNPATPPQFVRPLSAQAIQIPATRFGSPAISPTYLPPNETGTPTRPLNEASVAGIPGSLYAGIPAGGVTQPFAFNNATDVPDIVMNDVLSFDVAVKLDTTPTEFVDLGDARVQAFNMNSFNPLGGNPLYPATFAAGQQDYYTFDTWTSKQLGAIDYGMVDGKTAPDDIPRWRRPGAFSCIPLWKDKNGNPMKILAIRITIRIWDSKSNQTRQTSAIFDL